MRNQKGNEKRLKELEENKKKDRITECEDEITRNENRRTRYWGKWYKKEWKAGSKLKDKEERKAADEEADGPA